MRPHWSRSGDTSASAASRPHYSLARRPLACTCGDLPLLIRPTSPLRARMAALAHETVLEHLVDLGVTAVELMPVHHSVPEQFWLERA